MYKSWAFSPPHSTYQECYAVVLNYHCINVRHVPGVIINHYISGCDGAGWFGWNSDA
jgi:hypothetical protein